MDTARRVYDLIHKLGEHGEHFKIEYVTNTGELRLRVARLKFCTSECCRKIPFDPHLHTLFNVYDLDDNWYRCINLANVVKVNKGAIS